ncbi:hypothetical protein GCM10025868_09660 [Angustibacter aerolatus]|uniref:DUF2344 domain-containing protein n=1 Tax=Angustibacter aerolatus TaxID=1162965 RepID=A0ABQ6JG13_9ACTN|nr:hypothetical protein GCM10025868_09660 [Angustibacter aerolatus]
MRAALDAGLPDGLDVLRVVEAQPGALADRLEASEWLLTLPGVTRAQVEQPLAAFVEALSVPVERLTKQGPRTLDAREPVVSLVLDAGDDPAAVGPDDVAVLRLVVRHVTPTVRPTEVLVALTSLGLPEGDPPQAVRLRQGPLVDGLVTDPLA